MQHLLPHYSYQDRRGGLEEGIDRRRERKGVRKKIGEAVHAYRGKEIEVTRVQRTGFGIRERGRRREMKARVLERVR